MIVIKDNLVSDVLRVAQTLTGSYVDVGEIINVADLDQLAIFANITANDSLAVQFKVLAIPDKDAPTLAYELPIQSVASNLITLSSQAFLVPDGNVKFVIPMQSLDTIPFIKIQVKAGTVGVTAGILTTLKIAGKNKRAGV